MTTRPSKQLINVNEYHLMIKAGILTEQDHVELVQGEIIKMRPIESKHVAIVNRINTLLSQLVGDKGFLSIQNPIKINEFSEPEPDIAVLKPQEDYYADQLASAKDALLIIEVADSSIDYDRELKLPIYEAAGVPEYWIIDLENNQIEAYHQASGDIYRFKELARRADQLTAKNLELTIPVKDLIG